MPSAAPSKSARSRGLTPAAQVRDSGLWTRFFTQTIAGVGVAFGVYLITNPYIVINALGNREVLQSNFGNSLAMYEIARIGEGFIRVLELTVEGATLPILVLGVIALLIATLRKNGAMVPLVVPAAVFFLQFVLIGAGKPAEYGRFGIFTNTALLIGTACLLPRRWTRLREVVNWIPAVVVVCWIAAFGGSYLRSFCEDASGRGSREGIAAILPLARDKWPDSQWHRVAVHADPAPYSLPPLSFRQVEVRLFRSRGHLNEYRGSPLVLLKPVDQLEKNVTDLLLDPLVEWRHNTRPSISLVFERLLHRPTPISWANKPFDLRVTEARSPLEGVSPLRKDN